MNYREFVKHAKTAARSRARTFTRPDDDWPMTIITDHPGEPPRAFDVPAGMLESDHAKDMLGVAIAVAARTTKPTKVAMIASAWAIIGDPGQPPPDTPPSRHPDRREIVIVVVADAERSEGWIAEIKRTRLRPPALGSFEPGDPGVGGRLIEPLIEALR